MTIDLRSDTLTQPTPAMRQAMAQAEVGDDVYGEDPTVNRLQRRIAELLGKEAALFTPSGTMANQIAVGVHTSPGDELLCDANAHVYVWECGGIARLSGVTTRTIHPRSPQGGPGLLSLSEVEGLIRPDDGHYVRTRLLCLENTHNRGGGKVHPLEQVRALTAWAKRHGLATHLDGARLFNAVVATGVPAATWAEGFDTVSVCFSKGLGAPVGSALVGSSETIARAHRLRKLFGGGMRQAGILAAAALYALDHHVERLADDHAHAQILAEAVERNPHLKLESGPVETNLVWIEVDPSFATAAQVVRRLKEQGVFVSALGDQVVRACTHLNVSTEQVRQAARLIEQLG
ncbi:L-threonine aldolase [Isosphaera pallida ATCC 43644]|uniref:L-threonine aldolase n=1 Tax=Isosphaera pallida (strain ATCC 43644 / DSM 9630 / IS1B) TaxID=575540 RepID=E8QYH5_ISOPI|nr:low-specificity L-threonine aldolase [Isosphaera pallida]ADV64158.1 L-threonine aldolase [Isosphaera pallida ATCC 43644]